jgi:hypothetical protein
MPLGDSITIGYGSVAGYRLYLWALARERDDLALDLVGSRTLNSPPQFPDPEHEGHSRWRVRDFVDFAGDEREPPSTIELLLAAQRPDVVLLHAGTNDVWRPDDWFEAADDLGRLLDRAQAHDPELGILVAQILPTVDAGANLAVRWLNARIARLVHARRAAGRRLGLVDMWAACPELTTADGVHPDHVCCEAMARAWLAGLDALDEPGAPTPPTPAPVAPVRAARAVGVGSLGSLERAVRVSGIDDDLLGSPPARGSSSAPPPFEGWRSEPLPLVRRGDGTALEDGVRPRLEFELDGRFDLTAVELWNGRTVRHPESWSVVEALREVGVSTSADGRTWVDRGSWELVAPRGAARRPAERREVDWGHVGWVRFEVRSTHARARGEGPPPPRCAALAAVRFRGRPAHPEPDRSAPVDPDPTGTRPADARTGGGSSSEDASARARTSPHAPPGGLAAPEDR